MTSAGLFSGEAFESESGMDDAFLELEALADELDEFAGFDDFGDDAFEADGFDGFEQRMGGLFVPSSSPRLISGPAAVTIARSLNPLILQSMDSDDAEAFFRRVALGVRGAVKGIARGGRVATPLLRRILPIIQRVASVAGPWGRVISAGIGAAQGLLEGRGVRGALAGAVGGLIPGVGGRIASSLLRADGADDDASLDALADMADARQVPPAVALPLGAGLAARVVSRQAVPSDIPLGAAAQGVLRARMRALEQQLLRVAQRVPGSPGRRLWVLRLIARLAARNLQRRGASAAIGAMPQVARGASQQVLRRVASSPAIGAMAPRVAAQRVQARRQLLRRVPVSVVSAASIRQVRA